MNEEARELMEIRFRSKAELVALLREAVKKLGVGD